VRAPRIAPRLRLPAEQHLSDDVLAGRLDVAQMPIEGTAIRVDGAGADRVVAQRDDLACRLEGVGLR
jgi:hypothetical protein